MTRPTANRLSIADMTSIALFSVLMAVCAWISIPLPPVPITLQTFALFVSLMLLGGRRGLYATLVYLLLGIAGLPVFSGFQGGLGVLLGATGGYVLGFPAGAVVYWLVTARLPGRTFSSILAGILTLLTCYTFGTFWYMEIYASASSGSLTAALQICVLPFLASDILKLLLAELLSHRLKKYLKFSCGSFSL